MPPLRLIVFLSVATFVLIALSVFVHQRAVRTFALPKWASRTFGATLAGGVLASLLVRLLPELPNAWAKTLGAIGGAVIVGVIVTSALLLPHELVLLLRRLRRTRRLVARAPTLEPAPPVDAGRRHFLSQTAVGAAVSVGMGASAYGTAFGRLDYTLESVPVRLAKLPRALDGFSIVQLSDIHVGLYVGDAELRRALALVKDARPDIVVLTGDLVDHDPRYAPVLARFVRKLRDIAPRGVFAVPGNHDYYAGVHTVVTHLREAGAEVLVNRHVRVGDPGAQFALGGFDDVAAPLFGAAGPQPERTFAQVPDMARVVLNHNPESFPRTYGAADLTLSGHTHGGQITLFINPAEIVLKHGFVRGHYTHQGSQLYVNRGFGTAGPPTRVGSPPEVTQLILTV
jgi:predicted MPP superfamily phosphohydrolase